MSPAADPLQPVPWSRMEELAERLLRNAPESLIVYGAVQIALNWKQNAASQKAVIYTTTSQFKDGAIIGIYRVTDSHDYRMVLYSFSEDTATLRNALLTTNKIKWNSPDSSIVFSAVPAKLQPVVEECLSHHNLGIVCKLETTHRWKTPDQISSSYHACPPEVRLAPLELGSVDVIKSNWFDLPGAAEYIETLIRHNLNLGVYLRSSGELCAWVLFSEFCTLGLLHTMEGHRRKGYAQLLCDAMCERLLRARIVVQALIVHDNTASLKLFKTLEFKSSPNNSSAFIFAKATGKPAV